MIAVDTTLLVAAHRSDSASHDAARRALRSLAGAAWAIPWPCVHEFLGVVTHPRVFRDPTPLPLALEAVGGLLASGAGRLIGEGDSHLGRLAEVATRLGARGRGIDDARIAAICLAHGVREFWTPDRDFLRVTGLRIRNPLREPAADPDG